MCVVFADKAEGIFTSLDYSPLHVLFFLMNLSKLFFTPPLPVSFDLLALAVGSSDADWNVATLTLGIPHMTVCTTSLLPA